MNGEHGHPVGHKWHERWDHETDINRTVGREGELTMLCILSGGFTLGLLRSRNGTTWIFSFNLNARQGPKISHCR